MQTSVLPGTPLGKKTVYVQQYSPQLLVAVPRALKRDEIEITKLLPFHGIDIWNGYELSWLNQKGKPVVALAEFIFPCESLYLVESKSFKLYLNSFNATIFSSQEAVAKIMEEDLSRAANANVIVTLKSITESDIREFAGICLDSLDIECHAYTPDAKLLTIENKTAQETLFSHLLKSNCLVTGQPDWGSLQISYKGQQINHASLLRYIVSYRNHNGFAEHCIEKMFVDILNYCNPKKLTLSIRYTRRGGLDINAIRSTETDYDKSNYRSYRQ